MTPIPASFDHRPLRFVKRLPARIWGALLGLVETEVELTMETEPLEAHCGKQNSSFSEMPNWLSPYAFLEITTDK